LLVSFRIHAASHCRDTDDITLYPSNFDRAKNHPDAWCRKRLVSVKQLQSRRDITLRSG
jgi:hypothetical protein